MPLNFCYVLSSLFEIFLCLYYNQHEIYHKISVGFFGGEGRLGKSKQTKPFVYSMPFSPIHSENTTQQCPAFSTVEKKTQNQTGQVIYKLQILQSYLPDHSLGLRILCVAGTGLSQIKDHKIKGQQFVAKSKRANQRTGIFEKQFIVSYLQQIICYWVLFHSSVKSLAQGLKSTLVSPSSFQNILYQEMEDSSLNTVQN